MISNLQVVCPNTKYQQKQTNATYTFEGALLPYGYIEHLILESEFEYDDEEFDNPLDEANWLLQTIEKYMKFVIYNSCPATEPRATSNQKLISFRKCIKREETAYPTLKDEWYFDSFITSLYITAKSHECEDALNPEYTPSNLKKNYLMQNKFSYFLYWINIYWQTWVKSL